MFKDNKFLNVVFTVLVAANIFIWYSIAFTRESGMLQLSFLDVGQGDSQLINFKGVQMLIDGGKGPQVLLELPKLMDAGDRYIDLVIATHPDLDHFGGLIDVLKTYEVGAVITNGRKGTAGAYADFEKVIVDKGIPEINLLAGDKIRYQDIELETLWPLPRAVVGKKVNESGIVLLLKKDDLRVLYTADIGFETEQYLVDAYDIRADVLKVGHHGSKYSSGSALLREVSPKISLIGVGKNSYGHPTDAALHRLADVSSQVFRTDQNGTLRLIFDGKSLKVYD